MTTTTTDKMVEIARFQYPAEAHTLMALLQSEDIDCYLRNEHSSQVLPGYAVGGARVELLESDVPRALEVMKAGGYEIPEEDEEPEEIQAVAGWARRIPFLRKLPLEKQILALLILVAVCLGLFIYFGTLTSPR
ncbi:MAG: DUF2007 domain-containing protein [Tannerellaceae bacterium]|jgi:hypothetical protein|nr:DUF2007 domain-containing protein [Tannerellaceae bacterium]